MQQALQHQQHQKQQHHQAPVAAPAAAATPALRATPAQDSCRCCHQHQRLPLLLLHHQQLRQQQ
jgi:hypothetical protein